MEDNLERFLDAQKYMYDQAYAEIKQGEKKEHWIGYIFPQIIGLGKNSVSKFYGIRNIDEALEYYRHPILGHRLLCVSKLLIQQEKNIYEVFGSLDAMKVRSCMTLFYLASGKQLFKSVLDKWFEGKMDEKTLEILNTLQNQHIPKL